MQILEDFNATPGSTWFNEICDMLQENNVKFSDTDIRPDHTYTHANNGSQTRSWLDHIELSDVLSDRVDSWLPHSPGCCMFSDLCAITVELNFDQLTMSYNIER